MKPWGAVVLLVLAGAGAARADNRAEAKDHFKRATSLYALGRFSDAAIEYEKAYELMPDPALLYNAAQANRIAGNKPRALLLYQNYLRIYGDKVGNAVEVRGHIEKLQMAIEIDAKTASAPPMAPAPAVEPTPSEKETPPAVTVSPEPKKEKPLVKKPWFWAVVGGAVVVVAVGVTLGVVLGSPGERDPNPSLATLRGN
jgi:tetratricopeptide (TPR) repeat protein